MKYIFYSDFNHIVKKNKKIFFGYFILIIGLFLLERVLGYFYNTELFCDLIGLHFDLEGNYLTVLPFLFNILFFLWISSTLFTNDFKTNIGNIFLRIKAKHYIFYKLCSITFMTLFFKIIIYGILILLYLLNQASIENVIWIFVKDFLFITILEYAMIQLYIFGKKMMKVVWMVVLALLFVIGKHFDIMNINLYGLCIAVFILFILVKYSFRKFYTLLFE